MFTKFHNVSFIASSVTGLEREGRTIHILTPGQSYEVRFDSITEAEDGLLELTDIINEAVFSTSKTAQEAHHSSNADDLKNVINTGFNCLQSILANAKSTATNKVQESMVSHVFGAAGKTVSDLIDRKDDLVQRATDLLSTLDNFLSKDDVQEQPNTTRKKTEKTTKDTSSKPTKGTDESIKRATSIIDSDGIFTDGKVPSFDVKVSSPVDAKKITAEQFQQIFGTPDEPVIGDMSERQVREFIAGFVDGALSNERVQLLFQNIKDNFGENEAESAIEGYKNLILTISLQNTEMTLSEIISRYFS